MSCPHCGKMIIDDAHDRAFMLFVLSTALGIEIARVVGFGAKGIADRTVMILGDGRWLVFRSSYDLHDRRSGQAALRRMCASPVCEYEDAAWAEFVENIRSATEVVGLPWVRGDLHDFISDYIHEHPPGLGEDALYLYPRALLDYVRSVVANPHAVNITLITESLSAAGFSLIPNQPSWGPPDKSSWYWSIPLSKAGNILRDRWAVQQW